MPLSPAIEAFIQDHFNDDLRSLRLQRDRYPDIDIDLAINQIVGRKKASTKLPGWAATPGILFPPPVSMEQCSSELTAKFKAELVSGKTLIDLTGGFGVDSYYMSEQFEELIFVEHNNNLLDLVSQNFQVLDFRRVWFIHSEGISFLNRFPKKVDWIYLDPTRRGDSNKRVFLLEDCQPNIVEHQELLLEKADHVLFKLSPMIDIAALKRSLRNIAEIFVVAVRNEVKELLIHCRAGIPEDHEITVQAINLLNDKHREVYLADHAEAASSFSEPQKYIYEPNKAILKAGLQDNLATAYQLNKLETHSHFYTSDYLNGEYPGRVFHLSQIVKAKEKEIRKHLPDQKANIISRNFPLSAPQLYQKLKITPGGEQYLLATTLHDGKKTLLLCQRIK